MISPLQRSRRVQWSPHAARESDVSRFASGYTQPVIFHARIVIEYIHVVILRVRRTSRESLQTLQSRARRLPARFSQGFRLTSGL